MEHADVGGRLALTRSSAILQNILKLLVFLVGSVSLGYCSANYAMTRGVHSVSISNGPWTTWPYVASPSADPYTRAHFAGTGKLAVTSYEATTFRAVKDSDGEPLTPDCSYTISGAPLASRWWSLTVYDEDGLVMANPAERYSFNSTNIARHPDGSFSIGLSRDVLPGNWIPLSDGGKFLVLLRIYMPDRRLSGDLANARLPAITKGTCI